MSVSVHVPIDLALLLTTRKSWCGYSRNGKAVYVVPHSRVGGGWHVAVAGKRHLDMTKNPVSASGVALHLKVWRAGPDGIEWQEDRVHVPADRNPFAE